MAPWTFEEAKAAASVVLDRLSEKELGFASKEARDRFKSKLLDLTVQWFREADHDGDGTLDNDELRSPAGRKLEKLLTR
jgi:hypothetical protein